jgi:hypothetical protein
LSDLSSDEIPRTKLELQISIEGYTQIHTFTDAIINGRKIAIQQLSTYNKSEGTNVVIWGQGTEQIIHLHTYNFWVP